jgi:hypothetical protein
MVILEPWGERRFIRALGMTNMVPEITKPRLGRLLADLLNAILNAIKKGA